MATAALFYKQSHQSWELISQSSRLSDMSKEIKAQKTQKYVDVLQRIILFGFGCLPQLQLSTSSVFSLS